MSRADQHELLPPEKAKAILEMLNSMPQFPLHLGAHFDEVRLGYAQLSLPYRSDLNQPGGMVHGGVLATMIDCVVVPALLSELEAFPRKLLTINLHIDYLSAATEEDLVAEGWVTKRGRSVAFLSAVVATTAGEQVAQGQVAYRVVP